MKHLITVALALIIAACAPTNHASAATSSPLRELSQNEKQAIGKKIWQNESGGTVEGLTAWNVGEEFPSLGIGHFIWYPAGFNGRFTETWPLFVRFAKERGANVPSTGLLADCPWNSRQAFLSDFRGERLTSLRTWLSQNITIQTDFIITRSRAALPKILAAAPAADRPRISANYQKTAATAHGTYALIDYVNFKGDGTNPSERYNGKGWGLLQVLGGMKDVSAGQAAAREFAESAKRALNRRIENSPPARGESRWRAGWNNRCDTYARPL